MTKIKKLFFLLLSINVALLMVFLNRPQSDSSLELNAHVKSGNTSLKSSGFMEKEKLNSIDVYDMKKHREELATVDANKDIIIIEDKAIADAADVLIDEGNKENFDEEKIEKEEEESGVEKTPEEKKKDELIALNKRIMSDPQLKELVQDFKALKAQYIELGDKYKSLEKTHKQLKTNKNPTKKETAAPVQSKAPPNKTIIGMEKKVKAVSARANQVQMVLRYSNPFYLLGAYPNITLEYFNSYPDGKPFYERFNYGLYNDPDYCELADLYNLAHPENMFKRKTFFSDYAKNGLPRKDVIKKLGYDLSPRISKYMPKRIFKSRLMHMDPRITNFFTKRVDLHIYHEIGKHFLCATQMYNHIPGHGVLKRKDLIVDSVDAYALRYKDRSSCFNKQKFFPFSHRLYVKEECKAFFAEINSQAYRKKLETEPIQYLIKIGFGSHRAKGVFLLDKNKTYSLMSHYQNGRLCGVENRSLIAQTYVTNPLLLDLHNKFDFRIYMLIASTNPLIAYYHDGFLRVSLQPYDKFSTDRSTHLTNTDLSKTTFKQVKKANQTLHGMNEGELRDYQMWTLERLQNYLLESGKISDPNWLDNYLRPKFKEAFIHIIRMTSAAFWKQSNVYEMFGLDFMLDSELNLWFIECNSSPQLVGTNEYKTQFLIKMLHDLFDIQYGYYRSRMKRIVDLIRQMDDEGARVGFIDYPKWQKSYVEAWKNRFEPAYAVKANNSFEIIIDENLEGPKAYFGNLRDECVDN